MIGMAGRILNKQVANTLLYQQCLGEVDTTKTKGSVGREWLSVMCSPFSSYFYLRKRVKYSSVSLGL